MNGTRIGHRCKPDIDFRMPNKIPVLSIWQFWNDDSIDRVGTRRMIAYETEFDLLTISPLQRNDDFGKEDSRNRSVGQQSLQNRCGQDLHAYGKGTFPLPAPQAGSMS